MVSPLSRLNTAVNHRLFSYAINGIDVGPVCDSQLPFRRHAVFRSIESLTATNVTPNLCRMRKVELRLRSVTPFPSNGDQVGSN